MDVCFATSTSGLPVLDLLLERTERVTGVALSLYLRQQILLTLQEVRVLEDLLATSFYLRLVEVIHVELPDERRKVVVLEVLGQDLVAELLGLLDDEAVARLSPGRNVLCQGIVDDLEKLD